MKPRSNKKYHPKPCVKTLGNAALLATMTAEMDEFRIVTSFDRAAFIASVGHETGQLSTFSESLNYSADGLLRTWPSRFTPALSARLAGQPEAIANHDYCGRYRTQTKRAATAGGTGRWWHSDDVPQQLCCQCQLLRHGNRRVRGLGTGAGRRDPLGRTVLAVACQQCARPGWRLRRLL